MLAASKIDKRQIKPNQGRYQADSIPNYLAVMAKPPPPLNICSLSTRGNSRPLTRQVRGVSNPDSADTDGRTPLALAAARNRGSRASSKDAPSSGVH